MRVVTVSGARDSGKTTLIREIIALAHAAGKRSAVIVNEEGRIPYGDDMVKAHGLTMEYIRGG
jgi:G3E family GTPase